jgi:hypothetical protein
MDPQPLQADAMVMFGFMPDGKFAAVHRTDLNEVRIIVGSADHIWHTTQTMTPQEREAWDRSLADYGPTVAPAAATATDAPDS